MITFKIDTEYIELIKLLKATRVAESGAQAKIFVEDEIVLRNGEVETRKRAKIVPGDKIEIFDEVIVVE
jgi:ribosome-associated protein